jgi:hypothetical protein
MSLYHFIGLHLQDEFFFHVLSHVCMSKTFRFGFSLILAT